MDSLRPHRDYLAAEWQRLCRSPLSTRQARLVAALVDAYVDRLFAADPQADDILAFRAARARQAPALDLVMSLCAGRPGLGVAIEAVEVPLEVYGRLGVEDFMVSLYNDHSVQRVVLTLPDGTRRDMIEVLKEAIGALDPQG